ncbi:MAG TPA: mechanosensitive ion channel protein MscS [Bacteroidales bacterium]|nr:mechanosensitive ion channel protein MscS [Bacteroidales bacterium]
MILLQTNLPTPPVITGDSLRNATEALIQKVQEDPNTFLHDAGQSLIHFGIKVLIAIVVYLAGAWVIKQSGKFLRRLFQRRRTEATLASFITSLFTITSSVLLIIVTVGTLGVDTTSLAALLAAGGMAVGMALSGTVQNFAGGIMLLIFKPFKAGDYIKTEGAEGTVKAVSIVSTKIQTTDNREIILPNGALSNGNIDNYTVYPLRRVQWTVSVSYGTPAEECINLLQQLLRSDKRILDSSTDGAKDPFVALLSLNANDISFLARAWVKTEDYWDVTFDLNKAIYTELPKAGITFAYPHVDVTLLNQEKS